MLKNTGRPGYQPPDYSQPPLSKVSSDHEVIVVIFRSLVTKLFILGDLNFYFTIQTTLCCSYVLHL